MMSGAELFKLHNDEEYLEFDKIDIKLASRPDVHAFIMLDSMFPSKRSIGRRWIIQGCEHEMVWLDDVDIDSLSEGNIIELIRCGVSYDSDMDRLYMFV